MKIILKDRLIIRKPKVKIKEGLVQQFTVKNPAYIEAKKHGRWIDKQKTPSHLKFYEETASKITVPVGYLNEFCKDYKIKRKKIIDRTICPAIDINFTGTVRPYQQRATSAIDKKRYGILEAGTGAGKTFCGIAMIAKRKTTTLIVVHTKVLQQQWLEALEKFTDIKRHDIGFIGGGKPFRIGKVTIGIVTSVAKNIDVLHEKIGFLILDECHRSIANSWRTIINGLKPKYQLGLTATPYRKDKLDSMLFKHVGPIIHKIPRKELEQTGSILVPRVITVPTKFSMSPTSDYQQVMRELTSDLKRISLIAEVVHQDWVRYKEPIIIISDRVEHCQLIQQYANTYRDIRAVLLTGRTHKVERVHALAGFKNGRSNVLISTVQLIGEGFDMPSMNAMLITTPIRFKGKLLQSIGRIIRPSEGVRPRVYDFRDNNVGMLRNSGFARNRIYKEYGWFV